MKATILDLRYRMNDVLKALDRNETVAILYHGKQKGVLTAGTGILPSKVREHPFFNMRKGRASADLEMSKIRGGRYRAL